MNRQQRIAAYTAGVLRARHAYYAHLNRIEAGSCGTTGGHAWHLAHNEKPCRACADAMTVRQRARYLKKVTSQ